MSRSQPATSSINPAVRWFEWDATEGRIKFYDKTDKKNIYVDLPFTFLVLDRLATVSGFHEPSGSNIYANEVRSTKHEPLTVKSFKGGVIARGLYSEIKEKVNSAGGKYAASIYIAFKGETQLDLGHLKLSGCSLGPWIEFVNENEDAINKQAVAITGSEDGKKGKVEFKSPIFALKPVSEETNAQALALDEQLQQYLSGYLAAKAAEAPDKEEPASTPQEEEEAW